MKIHSSLGLVLLIFTLIACDNESNSSASDSSPVIAEEKPASVTKQAAKAFLVEAEQRLSELREEGAHASWLAATYISYDSQIVRANASRRFTDLSVELANTAAIYNELALEPDDRRKMNILKRLLTLPAPSDSSKSRELADIGAKMSAIYGAGEYCQDKGLNKDQGADQKTCLSGDKLEKFMNSNRDPEQLKEIWVGWRKVAKPMKPLYQRQVEIANEGARDLGYDDLGVFWRSKYDMEAEAFSKDVDMQWQKVKPFYDALHCHVRAKLSEHYGDEIVPASGPIPAHLLGNQWAQTWGNIYDLVKPENTELGYDLDELVAQNIKDKVEVVKIAEAFFTSLGFDPLPDTFWERSMFVEPLDHKAVCHASAWNLDSKEDLRIKMCIDLTAEDFETAHHELGHNFYQRAYNQQPLLFRGSANDGFHEALGDTISLSVTPKYLKQIGWLAEEPGIKSDLGYLMKMALDKIAFLPFSLVVDKWRWQVFSGEVTPADYNKSWWALRNSYQGVMAPVVRTEDDFDPGAKYHIPGNTPYTRYFLAFIQQFQFHRALCETAGYQGPLHRCSIYGNKMAGEKLKAMMEMGASRPWQDAMQAITGQPELDASAIINYFAPLKVWLDKENESRQCGW